MSSKTNGSLWSRDLSVALLSTKNTLVDFDGSTGNEAGVRTSLCQKICFILQPFLTLVSLCYAVDVGVKSMFLCLVGDLRRVTHELVDLVSSMARR